MHLQVHVERCSHVVDEQVQQESGASVASWCQGTNLGWNSAAKCRLTK